VTLRERLDVLLPRLPDERLRQLVDFAEFLALRDERADWQRFGESQLAKAYGDSEPEYTLADVKRRESP
jgi:hypothetical protein